MSRKIISYTAFFSVLGFLFAFFCLLASSAFQSIIIGHLPSFVGMALSVAATHIGIGFRVLFWTIPIIQWGLFAYSVSSDIINRDGRSRMSLLSGIGYSILCLCLLPLHVSNMEASVKDEIYFIAGFHVLLGFAIALMPLLLTFKRQTLRVKVLVLLAIIAGSMTAWLAVYYLNKDTVSWYSVSIRKEASVRLYDVEVLGWGNNVMPGGTSAGITTPVPKQVTLTWKTALPGGEEHYEEIVKKQNEWMFSQNFMDSTEIPQPPDELFKNTYPEDLFDEHKAVVELKDVVPRIFIGDIIFSIKDGDEVELSHIEKPNPFESKE